MNELIQRWSAILLLATLPACTLLAPPTEAPAPPTVPGQTGEITATTTETPRNEVQATQWLLNFASGLRTRSSAELAAELELLNKAYALNRTEENRLKLALFHAITPNGDRMRALALLDVAPGDANGRGRQHPFAAMLIPLLQDARKQDEAAASQQQRLRDEQRKSEALQQKLDALRDIERSMLERPAKK